MFLCNRMRFKTYPFHDTSRKRPSHSTKYIGMGNFELFFLRTKDKREIDFLVSRDGTPWFLVEVKSSDTNLSKNLAYFQKATGAENAFQVAINEPFLEADCFSVPYPVKVPARTFLSQLA